MGVLAIKFAEWLSQNHYILCNVDNSGVCFWKNEYNQKTSKQLYKEFLKDDYFIKKNTT
jgi:hypothetical protein